MRALLLACLMLLLATPVASAQTPNACGCYRDSTGNCKCTKKAKCGCPEECEPVGCEAKRAKDADREAAAELKRINAREKQRAAAAAKAPKKQTKAKREVVNEPPPPPEQQQLQHAVDEVLATKPPKPETNKKATKAKREEILIP